ncbi:hypothetical protein D0962_02885 [Leptolyngbyaceae cyanobacterium CCMR0082]|uniref:Uncharacterized protein n=1 Tax=Adonisia turfae CCMR0082 TaxID=2304604 RepID=A0A6M0RZS9_9CYAN|nr:hypothetical protein [Adonisia turfae CCMR0082]
MGGTHYQVEQRLHLFETCGLSRVPYCLAQRPLLPQRSERPPPPIDILITRFPAEPFRPHAAI